MPRRAIAGGFGVASPAINANFIELYDLHHQGFSLWGNVQGELSDQADLVAALGAKADLAYVDAGLAGKSPVTHDHDSAYSPLGHNHDAAYSPLGHGHVIGDVSGLQIALDGKAATGHDHNAAYAPLLHDHDSDYSPLGHVHAIANVTGLQSALDGKAAAIHDHDADYAPLGHNHDSLYAAIGHDHAGVYAEASHSHAIADVSGLQTALDGKSPTSHNHNATYAAILHNHDSTYSPLGHNHTGTYEPANANIQAHISSTSNPHGLTAAQIDALNHTAVGATGDDPNTFGPGLRLANHANCPPSTTGTSWWYILTLRWNTSANYSQLALSYHGAGSTLYIRHIYSGTWAPWARCENVQADWNGTGDAAILNKPSAFPPDTHSHAISDVTGLQDELDNAGGGMSWSVVSSNTTGATGNGYLFDNSSAVHTLTLPASPSVGDTVAAGDLTGDFQNNALTIARNGSLIMGQADDLTLDVKNQRVTLVYSGATRGWVITELEPNGSQWEYMPYANAVFYTGTSPTLSAGAVDLQLNQVNVNEISGCSLNGATGEVTLPAGDYLIQASGPTYRPDAASVDFFEVRKGDGTVLMQSTGSKYTAPPGPICQRISFAAPTVIKLTMNMGATATYSPDSSGSRWGDICITKIGGNYAPKPIISSARYEMMAGLDTTGGVMGFNLSKTGANQVTVTKGVCLDSNLSVALTLTSNTAVNLATTANQLFHFYVVRLTASGLFSVRAYTTEAAVASDTEVDAFRWIGWWKNDGAGEAVAMTNNGEYYLGNKASDWVVSGSIGTSYATVDHSAFIPESRVELIKYGVRDAAVAGYIYVSDDGVNISLNIGYTSSSTDDTSGWSAWGQANYAKSFPVPYNPNRLFRSTTGTLDLLIHAVKVRR